MWRLQTFLAIGVSAIVLAACGGQSDTSSGGSNSGSSSNQQDEAQVRLRRCLRENGVDVPDRAGGGAAGDIDVEALQEALDGPCKALQDEAFGDVSEQDQQEFQDAFAKFSQCMRDAGVDVPDIAAGERPPTGFDADDPDVQAAMEKCQGELPQGGLPGGGGQ